VRGCSNELVREPEEITMYMGGGIPGTILVIVVILWMVRRNRHQGEDEGAWRRIARHKLARDRRVSRPS
jgi:hypothetical protein